MANPRDALKNNPLKPKAVGIPQVDPFSDTVKQPESKPKPVMAEKAVAEKALHSKVSSKEKIKKSDEAALYVTISKEDKKWLNYYRFDQGKTLNEVVTEAIDQLRKNSK